MDQIKEAFIDSVKVQCPICMDEPEATANLITCREGHWICEDCNIRLESQPISARKCPECRNPGLTPANATTKRAVQELIIARGSGLDDMHDEIMDSAMQSRLDGSESPATVTAARYLSSFNCSHCHSLLKADDLAQSG